MTTATTSERLLYRIPEVAGILGMSRTVIYELIGAGRLRAVHIGKSIRVPAASIDEFVAGLEAER